MEKKIKDFDNYTINKKGEVFNTVTQKFKKPQQYKNGYLFVSLYQNGRNKIFLIHRLVAEAFLPNPENKPCVGHWDCIRTNNNVENLYWCSQKENMNNTITKKNISKSRQGYTPSEETKKKMSESASKRVGELNSFYGKKHTDQFKKESSDRMKKKISTNLEYKKKMDDARIISHCKLFKPKDQIDPITGEIIKTWYDYVEFSKSEYNSKCVRRCCEGERKTYKGFIWKYHQT